MSEAQRYRPIIAARAVRGIGDGFVSILLAQYLEHLGYSGARIGIIVTATLLGSAILTLYTGLRWSHLDSRRVLLGACVLMAFTGFGFATVVAFWPLLVVAIVGTLNPSGGDVSVFLPIEQAAIADLTSEAHRPRAFAIYNISGGVGIAVGALCSAIPARLADRFDWDRITIERRAFAIYLVTALIAALIYRTLSVQPAPTVRARSALRDSRRIVVRLAALFSIDSAGGGFAFPALLVLYLSRRFQLDPRTLAATFTATSLLASFSQLISVRIAARIGLVRTMVFTHLPANIFLVLAGLAPNAPLAIACLLARSALSSMDIPARQALVMRLVPPHERGAAASVTNVPRSLAAAATPALAGFFLDRAVIGVPLIIGGVMKIAYDLLLLSQPLDRD